MATSRRVGVNENISTYGTTGRDYTSLATWEAATDVDLVTATTSEVLECYADAVFDDGATFQGATTDSSYFRIVRAAPGHEHGGIPGAGVVFSSGNFVQQMLINESFFTLQDIEVESTTSSASGRRTAITTIGGSNVYLIGCIGKANNPGAGVGVGIELSQTSGNIHAINCLAYECEDEGFRLDGNATKYVYNCDSIGNSGEGFERIGGVCILKNCLAYDNTGDDYGGTAWDAACTNNASQDTTAPGSNAVTEAALTFVDAGNNDWHLANSDTDVLGQGTDLSGDSQYPFDDDVDAVTIVAWSIGFDSDPPGGPSGGTLFMKRRRR